MKKAFITGVGGQDGAYLAQLLIGQGYEVLGGVSSRSEKALWRLDRLGLSLNNKLKVLHHDVTDLVSSLRILQKFQPDEIYNLAAQSFVQESFNQPLRTFDSTAIGPLALLEALKQTGLASKFYQASSSEMFGLVQASPQNEETPFYPRSPYGVAKLAAHWTSVNYRESYGIFATSGILFNHESPLRGQEFVTRKITNFFARRALGYKGILELGNLEAERDWGFAGDYVKGMWGMMQLDSPDTFVLATGKSTKVRDFVKLASAEAGVEIEFEGQNETEVARDQSSGEILLRVSKEFFRPAEVDILLGDASKAKERFGWAAETSVESLCSMMVREETMALRRSAFA
jgi:GDPmannose 4,6-dehydratase